ncbi:MAG: RNA polymerase sigma factor SigF [Actinomycetota bacterium]|nr:RNA polymerase sigma factor SigF [Actinomycetota bacterium]
MGQRRDGGRKWFRDHVHVLEPRRHLRRRRERRRRPGTRTGRSHRSDPQRRRRRLRDHRRRRCSPLPRDEANDQDGMNPARRSREELRAGFEEYSRTRDRHTRNELIEAHRPLATHLARRYANRGEPVDDLVQVASVGLLKAVERFDPGRGLEFSTFATATVEGELKRHFRDKGWAVRVPRRLQELHLELTRVVSDLGQELGRSPTVAEIARAAGTTDEAVLEGLEIAQAYNFTSLDAPIDNGDGSSTSFAEHLGAEDEHLENLEYRASLAPEMAKLPERERRILYLRFFKGMTQSEIADKLGISQMHVSRLLNRTLAGLREALEE